MIYEVEQVVSEWMARGITDMKHVISVMMRKGGAGKSTLTLLLADALIRFGLNVLIIDMDPQGNACTGLGRKVLMRAVEARIGRSTLEEPDVNTVIEVIQSGEPGVADEAILLINTAGWQYPLDMPFHRGGPLRAGKIGKIGLIPSYKGLEDLPTSWKPTDFERLAQTLHLPAEPGGVPPAHRWDVVLIDTAIARALGVQSAKAAKKVLFVTNAEKFGVDAIPETMSLVEDVRDHYYHDDIDVMGLVWNAYSPRQTTARALTADAAQAHAAKQKHWDAPIWPFEIPKAIVVSDSHDMAAPVSAFLGTSEKREPASKVCQVAEAIALRMLDEIGHPLAGELRAAWRQAWPEKEQTDVMTKGVA
ncbi:ParA family protein [Nonomuraea sp. NPDC050202]|jgi:cellulose biosynthesis protein BcsQ|uniref:ParA family protein n=1 Tax=Nonomuraea sp. NPDC050202 TaxID=3155035 RepID=UPI0033C0582C